jgi:hypothetical protein
MFEEAHPNVSLSDWRAFVAAETSRQSLIAEVVDRKDCRIPPWFVPLARGMAVASDRLLRSVGYRPGMACPSGWWEQSPEYFLWRIRFDCFLMVRECGETNLWTVERLWEERRFADYDEVLAHEFGSTPIVTRSPYSAMRLAMYCHENGPPNGLRFIKASSINGNAASAQAEGHLH